MRVLSEGISSTEATATWTSSQLRKPQKKKKARLFSNVGTWPGNCPTSCASQAIVHSMLHKLGSKACMLPPMIILCANSVHNPAGLLHLCKAMPVGSWSLNAWASLGARVLVACDQHKTILGCHAQGRGRAFAPSYGCKCMINA